MKSLDWIGNLRLLESESHEYQIILVVIDDQNHAALGHNFRA
jgi:hypothetical protein